MKNAAPNKPQPVPDPANLDQSELVSTQEVTVVPWFCGERKIALTWISSIANQFLRDAPSQGKK